MKKERTYRLIGELGIESGRSRGSNMAATVAAAAAEAAVVPAY